MPSKNAITGVTRQRIRDRLDAAKVEWWGRLSETEFLERLYDLDALPSTDDRFSTARADIVQHRYNNPEDWWDNWVYRDKRFGLAQGDDQVLLAFLVEMVHPEVRTDSKEVERLVVLLNEALAPDGYELIPDRYVSGSPVFVAHQRRSFHGVRPDLSLAKRALLTDPQVLHEHLDRIRHGVERDPAAAIGSCKELIESLCKIILDRSGVSYAEGGDNMPSLYRRVADLLLLKAESVPSSAKGSATSQKILRTLETTVQSLAELRNELGLGHGRANPSPALARHARLALNSTVAVTEFLLDTWQERVEKGLVSLGQRSIP